MIYKILSEYIITYHNDEDIREFMLSNMGQVIKDNPKIPLEVCMKPLLAHIKRSLDDTYVFNTFDFTFIKIIANHRNLNLELGIKISKILAQVCVK